MHTMRILLSAGVVASVLGGAGAAQAAFTPVTALTGVSLNPLAFTDAPGTVYAGGAPATYASGSQTFSFQATAGNALERDQTNNGYIDSNFANGTQLIAQCGFTAFSAGCTPGGSTIVSFAVPTTGFTLSADDFDTTQPYTFTASAFNGTTLLGTVTASSLADNGASPAVLAALSSIPITTLVLSDTAASAADGNFVVGDVATAGAASSVPEPASAALLLSAVASAGIIARRRSAP